MGIYLNPGNEGFAKMVNSEIYIDKTGMLQYTNHVLNTMQNCLCVSRPRRFGKSMAATMLAAYYSRECDSKALFSGNEIAESKDFEKYLNQYNTIFVTCSRHLTKNHPLDNFLQEVGASCSSQIFLTVSTGYPREPHGLHE